MKLNITLPVYNEEKCLESSVIELLDFLQENKFPYLFEIVIADNASLDNTPKIGIELQNKFPEVKYFRLNEKGRGRALKQVWKDSNCDIVSYMDIDLSTDLDHFIELIDNIVISGADLSIGCRLGSTSKVINRSPKREFLSRSYNFLLRTIFWYNIKDTQCGFKAIKRETFMELLPHLKNNNWFLDTEMILWANKYHKKISQVNVKWTDDPDTRVKVIKTVTEDLKGIARVKKEFIKLNFKK